MKKEIKITHINSNCYDSRFCLSHQETGKVEYDMKKIFEYIRKLENPRLKYN